MPITKDDQIDYDRVVADADYRRQVIVFLNTQARRANPWRDIAAGISEGGGALGLAGSPHLDRSARQPLRRIG